MRMIGWVWWAGQARAWPEGWTQALEGVVGMRWVWQEEDWWTAGRRLLEEGA